MRGAGVRGRLATARIMVPGHRTVTVPLTPRVPRDAEPGDHPGAIVALDERIDPGSGSTSG
ncbi:hypothetical protein Shyhy01_15800 [Streptomyces hygroscopicus subsp. hygroscopicus]|nr:hypothetical protein Shyhy01_15800 [Streptomyces hygroscopicus subsp. hygroscopicus]